MKKYFSITTVAWICDRNWALTGKSLETPTFLSRTHNLTVLNRNIPEGILRLC